MAPAISWSSSSLGKSIASAVLATRLFALAYMPKLIGSSSVLWIKYFMWLGPGVEFERPLSADPVPPPFFLLRSFKLTIFFKEFLTLE